MPFTVLELKMFSHSTCLYCP